MNYRTCLTNTNPAILVFFISWLKLLGVPKENLRARLQIYVDMNPEAILRFWAEALSFNEDQFQKLRIKNTNQASVTYKNSIGKGTCAVTYDNRDISEYVLKGIERFTLMNQ